MLNSETRKKFWAAAMQFSFLCLEWNSSPVEYIIGGSVFLKLSYIAK